MTKILGYKLKKDCEKFERAAVMIVQKEALNKNAKTFSELDIKFEGIDFQKNSLCYDLLKKAGVLDLWFDIVYEKPQFENGQWLCSNNPTSLFRYTSSGKNNLISICEIYKFLDNKERMAFELKESSYGVINVIYVEKPTSDQIKSILSKVAEYKGFKAGVAINQKSINLEYSDSNVIDNGKFHYDTEFDWLSLGTYVIYEKGKWATIIEEKKPEVTTECEETTPLSAERSKYDRVFDFIKWTEAKGWFKAFKEEMTWINFKDGKKHISTMGLYEMYLNDNNISTHEVFTDTKPKSESDVKKRWKELMDEVDNMLNFSTEYNPVPSTEKTLLFSIFKDNKPEAKRTPKEQIDLEETYVSDFVNTAANKQWGLYKTEIGSSDENYNEYFLTFKRKFRK